MLNEIRSDRRILITGGAGFIGGCLIRKLLQNDKNIIFNVDKLSYASNLDWLENQKNSANHQLIQIDLAFLKKVEKLVFEIKPDLIFHLAAESHVDRSIDNPHVFLSTNILGTFNLINSSLKYWESLNGDKKNNFRFVHISTDEVFGSLDEGGLFDENTPYMPRSPYSASKASSDHIVRAWNHTYGLPTLITNCSNNYGPWQFPEKLIPLSIMKAYEGSKMPLYGNGQNIRDWLFVEDHVDALILIAKNGKIGEQYCIGGNNEKTNKEVMINICKLLDEKVPKNRSYKNQIAYVEDRPGHDKRYAINAKKLMNELQWTPKYTFEMGLEKTVDWYINNMNWCNSLKMKNNRLFDRLGTSSKI